MSTSIPDKTKTGTMMQDRISEQPGVGIEFTGAVNLMAHPLAGAAAMTAIGFGMASQAVGLWMGLMSSAAEASQRLLTPLIDEAADAEAFSMSPKSASQRARAAARSIIADAQSVTSGVSETAAEIVAETIQDAAEVTSEIVESASEFIEASVDAVESLARVEPVEDAPSIVSLMPEDFRQPKAIDKPEAPDDLKTISGIGPKLEKVLNGLGIWTFGQIAALTAEEIAWVDDYLSFKGRIARDDWLAQAKALSGTN